LPKGSYVVEEIKAPTGYILENQTQTIEVDYGKTYTLDFYNKKMSGVQIIKHDSTNKKPLRDAQFNIYKKSGDLVGTFTTNGDGIIILDNLEPGWYKAVETKAPEGYILNDIPQDFEVTSNQFIKLVFENTPMSGLLIIKSDEYNTRKLLPGAVYDVYHADGQRVAGNILDKNQPGTIANSPNKTVGANGDVAGSYTTDKDGRIYINGLPAGEYHVVERQAPAGYELDTTVYTITVTPGKLATLRLTNRQKAGLILYKSDSVTKKPMYNIEFMLFDINNKSMGTFYTNNNGVINFGELPEGRYTIRETRTAKGYYLDEVPRTVEVVSGKVTEVRWENTPMMGQIQINKKSGDDNQVNGLPAGSPLGGAIFEVYEFKSGNLVDRFVSGADGRAISKPLPLGRYIIKEVQAPQWYKLSTQTLDIELEFATQIVKMEFLNYAANTGVYIKKTGPIECMPGQQIRYDIKEIRNTSTVPLTDFYWRDHLPVEAVRLEKIVTGTYNQALQYKILATTNKGDTRIIADNLSTTRNNVVDCSNASLGLKNDEYITSFTLMFGTVKAGFSMVEAPQIYAKTLTTLINGQQFANKVDVGGKYGSEWVVSNSTWVTRVYRKAEKLPRTGY